MGRPAGGVGLTCLTDRVVVTWVMGIVALVVVTVASLVLATDLVSPVDIEAARSAFIPSERSSVGPEPVERLTYLIAVATSLPILLVAQRLAVTITVPRNLLIAGSLALAAACLAFVVTSGLAAYVLEGVPTVKEASSTTLVLIGGLIAACVLVGASGTNAKGDLARRTRGILSARVHRLSVPLVAIILLSAVAARLRSASMIAGDNHFEAVFYSVSQVAGGKTLLADLPAQYGLYAELVAPALVLMGRSVLAFTAIMSVLQLGAEIVLLRVASHFIRLRWIFVLCALSFAWIIGSTWATVLLSPQSHEYFQIWPIRFLFPAASLAMFLRFGRGGGTVVRMVPVGLFCGLAIIWNIDSGVPVAGSFLAHLILRAIFEKDHESLRLNLGQLIGFILSVCAVVAAFLEYLAIKAGGHIELGDWMKYQTIFYAAGFGMLPMPPMGAWVAIIAVYLLALSVGVAAFALNRATATTGTLIFLAVLGIGLFTYYQGRSHDVVLAFVCWPAILIAFILADRALRIARLRGTGRTLMWTAVPIVALGVSISIVFTVNLPQLLLADYFTVRSLTWFPVTKAVVPIEFIKQEVGPDRSVAILAPAQSVYFAETGMASAVAGPGLVEAVLLRDFERILQALVDVPVKHLFIESDEAGAIVQRYAPLLDCYIVTGRVDRLLHLAPNGRCGSSRLVGQSKLYRAATAVD